MKYVCEYCNEEFEWERDCEEHEKNCEYNPKNADKVYCSKCINSNYKQIDINGHKGINAYCKVDGDINLYDNLIICDKYIEKEK